MDRQAVGSSAELGVVAMKRERRGRLATEMPNASRFGRRMRGVATHNMVNRADEPATPPEVDVLIEIPKGSFVKRGSTGTVDFISPLPCPFNYGSVPNYIGLEGDLLDALVLGPRLRAGTILRVRAWGAVTLTDRGMFDDKLVCSAFPLSRNEKQRVLLFFAFYARCKGLLNVLRRRPGRNACDGWLEASQALGRAKARDERWHGPSVPY